MNEPWLKIRIVRVGVLAAGKMMALGYFAFGLLLFLPMSCVMGGSALTAGKLGLGMFPPMVLMLLAPFFYALMGFVGGGLAALVYNLIVRVPRLGGGLELAIQEDGSDFMREVASANLAAGFVVGQSKPAASPVVKPPAATSSAPSPVTMSPVTVSQVASKNPPPPLVTKVAVVQPTASLPPTVGAKSPTAASIPPPPDVVAQPGAGPTPKVAVPAAVAPMASPLGVGRPPAPGLPTPGFVTSKVGAGSPTGLSAGRPVGGGYRPEIGMPASGVGITPGRAPGAIQGASPGASSPPGASPGATTAEPVIRKASSVAVGPSSPSSPPPTPPSSLTPPPKDGK